MDAYLQRIGASRTSSLAELQERHLLSVPFENLDIHMGTRIVLEIPWLHEKIVERRRGGFCYEVNGLFAELLRDLGHEVALLAARAYGAEQRLGPPFDHLVLLVDGAWLVDVGFGAFSLHPLSWTSRDDQEDPAGVFRLRDNGDDVDVFQDGAPVYRVERRPRELAEFVPTCWWHQTSPESHFRKGPMATRATPGGRITVTDRKVVVTENGRKTSTDVEDPAAAFREHFAIEFPRSHFRQSSASGVLRQL
ncbi:arylamine N-acetyltransferase family protein [Lentzea jiangxiensis]|uniref:N-hydroxyarylamine O-acetyltransferase n=1 Tax=Lentzea jiangxiensis TaxID=641025 RepID=A0A1H0X3H4_9PSEU|nr:arylamine N-acetyltransferase [Lentzea jiangxiensis]SDP97275.1 N-hydroxyarylamine O-acetyltransferase [Lentzea jiangxiensis]